MKRTSSMADGIRWQPVGTDRDRMLGRWIGRMLILLSCGIGLTVWGQEPASEIEQLALQQTRLADNYARLEQTIIRMAELEASTNPQRAALLKRAAQQSSERLTKTQLNAVSRLLAPPAQLKRAIDEQERALNDLKQLLELLLSEDRDERKQDERERVRQYIQEVERLIRLQSGLEGKTEGQSDPKQLSREQAEVADRTGRLQKKMEADESQAGKPETESANAESTAPMPDQENKPGEQKPGEQKPGEQKPGEQKPGEQKPGEQKPGEQKPGEQKPGEQKPGEQKPGEQKPGEQKPGEQKPGESPADESKPGESKPSESKPGQPMPGEPMPGAEGAPSDASESPAEGEQQEQNPARKRIQAAEDRMRNAERRLEEAQRKAAQEEQQLARQELEKAKAELEQILRQLREEEVERMLAMLEGRFQRMLEAQLKIYEATQRLDKVPAGERGRPFEQQASKLSFDEAKLVAEADRALLILVEEGSSVAFPETVQQMREEMQAVADRLAAADVGLLTQSAEEEIIAALEDLVAALKQAQKDLEEKEKTPPPPSSQQASPEDMPLVDQIAELKMIRALQIRVNTRTQRYAQLLENVEDPVGQATDAELQEALVRLAERQERIFAVTRDLVIGKNQ
jgi:uncharacterized low-complexity protein